MNSHDTSVDVYERLADALESLPGGFTRTPNRLEMKLLRLAFSPEEALVASTMSRKLETAAEIGQRVGLPEAEVTVLLERMLPIRKVRVDTLGHSYAAKREADAGLKTEAESAKKYRLSPFLVGWYEGYMNAVKPPADKEFAQTFEQYIIEGGGDRVFSPRPGLQGVVPYRGSLKPEWLEREPHNDIVAHFQRHDRFMVIDCVCKKEKVAAHGHSCDMPTKRCGFIGLPPAVPLSENVLPREEAMKLWDEIEAMGTMVHTSFYGFTMGAEAPQFVGACQCCGCCCGLFCGMAGRLGDLKETAQRSNYRVVKDYEKCHACGECVRRCQFHAHTFDKATDQKPVYNRELCYGCGACGQGCPSGALHLEPVPETEWYHVPSSFIEWEERRLKFMASENWRD